MTDSDSALREEALADPGEFVRRLLGGYYAQPVALARAAEVAGESLPAETVLPALAILLRHESAIVREGAACGLLPHRTIPQVWRALAEIATQDPSPGVRRAARAAVLCS